MERDQRKALILVVVSKTDKGISLKKLLEKIGYQVHVSHSLYDAIQMTTREMPHLIFTESRLNDGTAADLFTKLAVKKPLSMVPILVQLLQKTKNELEMVASKKFAGIFLEGLKPKPFLDKVQSIFHDFGGFSPFHIKTIDEEVVEHLTISMVSSAIGKVDDLVIFNSDIELDPDACLNCLPNRPDDQRREEVMLSHAFNINYGESFFNLFPLVRARGPGRRWLGQLPSLKGEVNQGIAASQLIYLYCQQDSIFDEYRRILTGYNIELSRLDFEEDVEEKLRHEKKEVMTILVDDCPDQSHLNQWVDKLKSNPLYRDIPIIVLNNQAIKSAGLNYVSLQKPLGMGYFLNYLMSSFLRGKMIRENYERSGFKGVPCLYRGSARLLGLDESGGVLEVGFPMLPGCLIHLEDPFLEEIFSGDGRVQVSSIRKAEHKNHFWLVQFSTVEKGVSKEKHWLKVVNLIKNQKDCS